FGFFGLSALRRPVEANWPSPALTAAVPLLAAAATGGGRGWDRWLRPGWVLGGLLVLVGAVHAVYPVLPLDPEHDPIRRGHGWDVVATRVAAVRGVTTRVATTSQPC